MVLKRKQIAIGAMVLLIGAAGYLNWNYGSTNGEVASVDKDGEYVPIGEAQTVFSSNENKEQTSDNTAVKSDANKTDKQKNKDEVNKKFSISQSKLERDNSRSEEIALLKSTLITSNSTEEAKTAAQQRILTIADVMDKEESIEKMISAKGLGESVVYISQDAVSVVCAQKGLSPSQAAQIKEIVFDFTQNNNVKIVELSE